MKPSKHNIFSKVHQSDKYFIINILSNNADLLKAGEARRYKNQEILNRSEYIEKGYLVEPNEENKRFRNKYLDFLDVRDSDEIQIFYVPNYFCNFNCAYCYQSGYFKAKTRFDPVVAKHFFEYVRLNFSNRKYYITLFGGEPLLGDSDSQQFLSYFIQECNQQQTELAIVTNGYFLKKYIPLLSAAPVREIQVTLDGTEQTHNSRRPLKNGMGTFQEIVDGIDQALQHKIPINLRMVVDRENINELPTLARFAINKGWTSNALFKTQIGRNYELHFCQAEQKKLYSRIGIYRDMYELIQQYPEILEFNKPLFSLSKHLTEQGELPAPLFDSCPACKTEWAFDYTGKIYPCTAAVGKPGEELGTFYPEIKLQEDRVLDWQNRDILNIPACVNCNLALACGGGCAMIAKHETGTLHAPDCRPVKELLEMGIALYAKNAVAKSCP